MLYHLLSDLITHFLFCLTSCALSSSSHYYGETCLLCHPSVVLANHDYIIGISHPNYLPFVTQFYTKNWSRICKMLSVQIFYSNKFNNIGNSVFYFLNPDLTSSYTSFNYCFVLNNKWVTTNRFLVDHRWRRTLSSVCITSSQCSARLV